MARNPNGLRRSRRRLLVWLGLGIAALGLIFAGLSGFYIDILWFKEVGLASVFWGRLWSRVLLGVLFGVSFFVVLYANLLIVRRIRPRYRVFSPEEEVIERYRTAIEPYVRWILPAASLLFAVAAGSSIAGSWEAFQLWRESGDIEMGVPDPLFGRDAAFYMLSLPFQKIVQSWLFGSLVTIALVSAAMHYLWGGIRVRAVGERVTAQVKAHLSVLLGLIVLTKAWGYRLGQFDLLVSERGVVTGASYTDVNAHLPALRLLVVIAIVCAVLFLVNIRFRGWALPVLGIGILALASIVGGGLVPTLVQRFSVAPQELQREEEYIERNIEFTRLAYGLDAVETRPFPAAPTVSRQEVEAAPTTIENIRLWNPRVLKQAVLQLQRIQPYYEFPDVDVDRYVVDGQRRMVMVAPREISQEGIPGGGGTWQNRHLFYTHGYGLAATRVDQVTAEGAPSFVLENLPAAGPLAAELQRPQLYIQEQSDVPFVVVDTDSQEFDFPQGEGGDQQLFRYDGEAGIPLGGFFRRAAFALRYGDTNLLISGLIDQESRILINTQLRDRVEKVAPFLSLDHDPYIALVDGRPVWIWDAYTTSSTFPYSEVQEVQDLAGADEEGAFNDTLPDEGNYIRNSVKIVVDAYDGTMTFYRTEVQDPIIEAWSRAFPDLMTPVSEAPASLQAHFRYPEDLFVIQSEVFANYHVTNPAQFYSKDNFWNVPNVAIDPTEDAERLRPYYSLLPLPGEEEEQFLLFVPFTSASRPNMVSWLAAGSDPGNYGQLVNFQFAETNVKGPGQAAVLMHADPEVSRETSLLDQRGSNVVYGDLLVIPIGRSFLYVQPLYLQSQQEEEGIPEMKIVVAYNGSTVSMGATLAEAIANATGAELPEDDVPEDPGEDPAEQTAEQLLLEAIQHFETAEAARLAGDLGTYQRENELGLAALREYAQLTGQAPPEDVQASPSPASSPGE